MPKPNPGFDPTVPAVLPKLKKQHDSINCKDDQDVDFFKKHAVTADA